MQTVSIIVPVYRVEPYLRACVDSLLDQTYRDLQVILVDDGSPDGCGAICDEYARQDSRVLALHKENGGVSSARNYGLDHATGTYITFCDGDDACEPDWIGSLVQAMERYQPDVVVGGYTVMGEDGTPAEPYPHQQGRWDTTGAEAKMEYCFCMVMQEHHGGEVWDRLFRRSIIQDRKLRFCQTCGNYAEDLGFVLGYSLYTGSVVAIGNCGYRYRIRSGSMMQTSGADPRLESLHQVFQWLGPVCEEALSPAQAQWLLPRVYVCLIASHFMSKVWSSHVSPEEVRQTALAGVQDWPAMAECLQAYVKKNQWRTPWYSGSHHAQLYSHLQFLLKGSWPILRIRCKLIRLFRPLLDWADRTEGPG